MTEALKPSEVLSRAADLIEPEGRWCQGAYSRPRGFFRRSLCLYGAVREAGKRGGRLKDAAMLYASRAIGQGPIDFNDAPARTQAEVVSALRKASELAKADGQ